MTEMMTVRILCTMYCQMEISGTSLIKCVIIRLRSLENYSLVSEKHNMYEVMSFRASIFFALIMVNVILPAVW